MAQWNTRRSMTDQLALPIEGDDSVQLGTARGVPLGRQWRGAEAYLITEAGKPGGAFCGKAVWHPGNVVWMVVDSHT